MYALLAHLIAREQSRDMLARTDRQALIRSVAAARSSRRKPSEEGSLDDHDT
jgi:hypothetical protein